MSANGYGVSFGADKNILKLTVTVVNSVNILKGTEWYTLSG